jgi:outer membrane biosynthesis protein TonB
MAQMFAHLSRPTGRTRTRIRRGNVAFSIVIHLLAIAILWRIPAHIPRVAPHEAAALIRMLTLPVPVPGPQAEAPAPPAESLAESAERAPESPETTAAPAPEAEVAGSPEIGRAPEPRLALGGGGLDGSAAQWPDTVPEMGPVPTVAMYRLIGGNDPPAVLNASEFTRTLGRRYPEILRARGVAGEVLVAFIVDRAGRVEQGSVTVLSYHGEEFAFLTVRYLPMLRFRPALLSGKAVRVRVELPVHWTPLG